MFLFHMRRFKQKDQPNVVTAHLKEGRISPGCNRVEVEREITTMTGTGRLPGAVTWMSRIDASVFDGFKEIKKL